VLLFAMVMTSLPAPVALGLLMIATAELVGLARGRWSALHITTAAIAIYVAASFGTSGVYGAATAGLLIALAGTVAHAIGALLRPTPAVPSAGTTADPGYEDVAVEPPAVAVAIRGRWGDLSPRESVVLSELVRGARNSEIAIRLGISERTVKAHLAHIYQKLGVESRSAAVAIALKEGLIKAD
jgi:DNA-binding CsgD family transcriptional regulator